MDLLKMIYIQSSETDQYSCNKDQLESLSDFLNIGFTSSNDKETLLNELDNYELILIDQLAFKNTGLKKSIMLNQNFPNSMIILVVQKRLRDEQIYELTKEKVDFYSSPLLLPKLITKFEGYINAKQP